MVTKMRKFKDIQVKPRSLGRLVLLTLLKYLSLHIVYNLQNSLHHIPKSLYSHIYAINWPERQADIDYDCSKSE